MIDRRVWPAAVLVLFCLPLFLGLRNHDLVGDEAAHAFSVDLMLETGDWLFPKQSPFPHVIFVEKPPLKFWIVAAGIKAGLPNDEFGQRFWDVLFGAAAFLYVFVIGRRLAGPWCGAVAVMILFIHGPLMFFHGLRENVMESSLLLCYAGGIHHFFAWASLRSGAADRRRRMGHVLAIAVLFSFGFMSKFVVALFLPVVLGLASLIVGSYRRRLLEDWRMWAGACALTVLLCAPWFVYANLVLGRIFWDVILGAHVYQRLTTFLDPAHVQPWDFYFTSMWRALRASNTMWLVSAGAVVFVVDGIRRRSAECLVVVLWIALPLATISFGTSKLYHYAYPFLPPLGLAAGYLIGVLHRWLSVYADRALQTVGRVGALRENQIVRQLRRPAVRVVFLALGVVSMGVLLVTLFHGPVSLTWSQDVIFRNRDVIRPGILAAVLFVLGGWPEGISRFGIPLFILTILPTPAYTGTFKGIQAGKPVLGPIRDCLLRVAAQPALMTAGPRGLYVDADGPDFGQPYNHQYTYYFRAVAPWHRPSTTPPELRQRYLFDPAEQRPLMMSRAAYETFSRTIPPAPDLAARFSVSNTDRDTVMILPGPYMACDPDSMALAEWERQSGTR